MKKFFLLFIVFALISCDTLNKRIDNTGGGFTAYDSIDVDELPNNQVNEKLKVGLFIPLTGKAAKIGETMLNAAKMALFEHKINNITLMPYDTKTNDFDAINAINTAIREGVNIIIGPFTSQATDAVVDIAERHGIIVISLSDNLTLLKNTRPNLFLIGLNPEQEMDRIISYFIDEKNFFGFSALFTADTIGNQLSKHFGQVIGRKDVRIVKRDFYSPNDKNLSSKVTTLLNTYSFRDSVFMQYENDKKLAKQNNLSMKTEFKYKEEDKIYTDALIIPDSGKDLIKIADLVSRYDGKNRRPLLIGTSKWMNSNLYNISNFNNTYFVSPDPQLYIDFNQNYYKIYQSYPLKVSSFVYDAVTSVIESYAMAQNLEDIRYALLNYQGFKGINGQFRYLNNGLTERKLTVIRIKEGQYEIVDYDNQPFLKY
ncbi:MAG: hypothetical protein Ta2D_01760 [Rickettsiales bacterium]|nr:MAG: hypothetical protein Ta2D_01760 [Rickettsiales bacterium]